MSAQGNPTPEPEVWEDAELDRLLSDVPEEKRDAYKEALRSDDFIATEQKNKIFIRGLISYGPMTPRYSTPASAEQTSAVKNIYLAFRREFSGETDTSIMRAS